MADKIMTVTISEDGIDYDLNGFHGKGCKELLDKFRSLGTMTKEERKPEFFAGPKNGNSVSVGR